MIFSSFKIDKDTPIYEQIEKYIMIQINDGMLQKGSKLPSTREVSSVLKVSRNSVVTAYENLESRGIIQSVKGKGTFVIESQQQTDNDFVLKWDERINEYGRKCNELDIMKTEVPWKKGMISFKSIAPEEKLFDLDEFKRDFQTICANEGSKILNYGYAKGYKPLIDYLLKYMEKKGVAIQNKDILITNGFTESFDMIISVLTDKEDVVLCESPTHNTAIKIMKARGVHIVDIPMQYDGIEVEKLEKAIIENNPKMLYIIPSYHNPTGIVMKGEKRQKVYNLCKKHNIPIVEDGFNEELLYSSSHMPPIMSLSGLGNGVVYLGSLSKILFPGLRLGWILADKKLISMLESVKRSRTIHCSTLDQALLCEYLNNGSFEKYVKKVRKYYREKYEFAIREIKDNLQYKYIYGEGGLHVFIDLGDIDARKLLKCCYENNVIFMPGDIFFPGSGGSTCMRLGFARLSNEDIKKGIKVIGQCEKEIRKQV